KLKTVSTSIENLKSKIANPILLLALFDSLGAAAGHSGVLGLVAYDARFRERPVAEERLAVDIFFGDEAPRARVRRVVAVVAHDEVVVRLDVRGRAVVGRDVEGRVEIRLLKLLAVDEDSARAHLHGLARKTYDALDVTLR